MVVLEGLQGRRQWRPTGGWRQKKDGPEGSQIRKEGRQRQRGFRGGLWPLGGANSP